MAIMITCIAREMILHYFFFMYYRKFGRRNLATHSECTVTQMICDCQSAETVNDPVHLNFDFRKNNDGAGGAFGVAPKLNVIETNSAELDCTCSCLLLLHLRHHLLFQNL